MNTLRIRTDFLFPNSDFITGIGSAFNLGGNYYGIYFSDNELVADRNAIESDWEMVGEDLCDAVDIFKSENHLE